MTDHNNDGKPDGAPKHKPPGVLKIIQSMLAGALGVQSSKRHEEDFTSGSPWPYIVAAIIFGAGFVITLMLIVKWVLSG